MTLMPVTRTSDEPACSEKLGASRWIEEECSALIGPASSIGSPVKVMMGAKAGRADRHGDGLAGVDDVLAADQAFGRVHGDGAHGVLAQMLGHFEHQTD